MYPGGELSGATTLSDLGDDERAGGSTEKLVKHLHSYLTEHLLPAVEKAKAEVGHCGLGASGLIVSLDSRFLGGSACLLARG